MIEKNRNQFHKTKKKKKRLHRYLYLYLYLPCGNKFTRKLKNFVRNHQNKTHFLFNSFIFTQPLNPRGGEYFQKLSLP